ncbi:MAG: TAXI family TRAP transporter solute-binding subunit, partial [Alphaproteobacteria bacterium]
MKTFARYAALGVLFAGIAATTAAEAKLKRITIGSNKQGSVFFLLASGFAKTLQQNLKIRSTAQPHAGSSVYLPLMDNGEITMGLNNSMDSGAAVRGKLPFRSKSSNVRAIARVWVIPYAFMVRADSGLKTIADLRGKKVVTKMSSIVSLTNLNIAMLRGGGLST